MSPTRDERQRLVGGLLEQVAGERAEAAGVDRQRDVDAVLGAQERHRAGRGVDRARRRALEVGVHLRLERGRALEQRPRRRRRVAAPRAGASWSRRTGFSRAQLEALRVDRAEQLGAAGEPRPAVVVGEPRERRERLGQPLGELGGRAPDVLAAVVQGCWSRFARAGLSISPLPSRALTAINNLERRLGVLAFGDSITNGGGELQWGVALQSWALWVARALGLPFTSYAVDGATRRRRASTGQIPAFERTNARPQARATTSAACTSASTMSARPTGTPRAFERDFRARSGFCASAATGARGDRAARPRAPARRREGRAS